MAHQDFGGVTADVCKSKCAALWLDCGEIRDLDEPHEGFGEALRRALDHAPVEHNRIGQTNCPHCSIPMREHHYRGISGVLIDECYNCGGFLLDPGELRSIRDALGERLARARKVQSLLADDPVWQAREIEMEHEHELTAAARKLNRLLMQRVFPFKWPP